MEAMQVAPKMSDAVFERYCETNPDLRIERTGAARSARVSWILRSRLATLTAKQKRGFPPICPGFMVELRSPSDRKTAPSWAG
jgi:Uma2 family endonuclease